MVRVKGRRGGLLIHGARGYASRPMSENRAPSAESAPAGGPDASSFAEDDGSVASMTSLASKESQVGTPEDLRSAQIIIPWVPNQFGTSRTSMYVVSQLDKDPGSKDHNKNNWSVFWVFPKTYNV